MSELKWKLNESDAGATLAVLVDGEIKILSDSDGNFAEVLDLVRNGYVPPRELFDVATLVSNKFQSLSERVSVSNGRIYFDGDEIDSSLSRHIQRLIENDVEDWKPFVLFLEKVQQNPEPHSREQLFDWLNQWDVTITDDGDFLSYKGVNGRVGGGYQSSFAGTAIVDGVLYEDQRIPQDVGSVVEMPRSQVHHDPGSACSVGLHAGSFEYATSWAPILLTVKINPRDVVSVPKAGEKLRVCRYTVLEVNEREYDEPVYTYEDDYESVEESLCDVTKSEDVTNDYMTMDDQGRLVNSQAKLTWDDVEEIRAAYQKNQSSRGIRIPRDVQIDSMARHYNVSPRTIWRIVDNQSWVKK